MREGTRCYPRSLMAPLLMLPHLPGSLIRIMFEFKWRNIPITLKIYCPLGSTVVFHSKNLIGCDEQPLPRIRKAHTRSMRGHRSKSLASLGVHHNTITRAGACNSLCSKTLPLSPLVPILYQGPAGVLRTQLVRFQYFAKTVRKKLIGSCRAFKRTNRFSREPVPPPARRRIICLHPAALCQFRAGANPFHESVSTHSERGRSNGCYAASR
jgi:hypothetical protein